MPTFDSFSYFQDLLPALFVIAPLLAQRREGAWRRGLLAVLGLYLLFMIAPRLALFHAGFWLLVFALQQAMARMSGRRGGVAALWLGVVVLLGPLVLWRLAPVGFVVKFNVWSNDVFRRTSLWLTLIDLTRPIIIPIGLSFATFRALDLLVKSNLGLLGPLSPGRVLAYGLFPPILVVGPIAEYGEVEATLERGVPLDRRRLLEGALLICSGLAKVFVGAYSLKWAADILTVWRYNSASRLWIGLVAYGWYFYLNFAGYADLAIGAGRWLGADLRPNFDRPYLQRSPTAFWNTWNISLTQFMRRNVFTPLGGLRERRQHLAIVATMMLIALWHDLTWSTVVFGVYHSVGLLAHRALVRRRPPTPGRALDMAKAVLVFFYFALSLPLLTLSLSDTASLYRALALGGQLQ